MKLSSNNPIIHITRWFFTQKRMMKLMPSFIHYGGWFLLAIYHLFGMKVLLLTTTGRKTGIARTTPVIYISQGQNYIISAHQAGSDKHPYWFLNLMADPQVTIELFWKKRVCLATEISDEVEKKELLSHFPVGFVDAFQEYTPRSFPVIRLETITIN